MAFHVLRQVIYLTAVVMMGVTVWVYAWTSQANIQIRRGMLPAPMPHTSVADSNAPDDSR